MNTVETEAAKKPPLKQRLNALMEEYGQIAIVTWLSIFAMTMVGFSVAIQVFGYQPDGAAGQGGILAIAYIATQATKPIRIAATLGLTPVIGRIVRRDRSR